MPTIFSKIIDGEIPCYKVAENDEFLAFLDINPNSTEVCKKAVSGNVEITTEDSVKYLILSRLLHVFSCNNLQA